MSQSGTSVTVSTFEKAPKAKVPGGFQSTEAEKRAAEPKRNPNADDTESAEIGGGSSEPVPVKVEDLSRRVSVTPRQSIPRTSIGGVTYSFTAGKKVTVPLHVAQLLDEKGVL